MAKPRSVLAPALNRRGDGVERVRGRNRERRRAGDLENDRVRSRIGVGRDERLFERTGSVQAGRRDHDGVASNRHVENQGDDDRQQVARTLTIA